jgi:DNA-binding NarL/FixJ family response regulator
MIRNFTTRHDMPKSPLKLLLIDPFEEDRAALLHHLRASSREFEVFEAPNGKVGLDLLRNISPDCVVMELKQEDMIGLEVLNLVQAEMLSRPVPLFVWTCLTHEGLRSAVSMLGVGGYFLKQAGSESMLANAILNATAE